MKPTNGYQGWQVHRRSGTAINYVLATCCRVNERRENALDSPKVLILLTNVYFTVQNYDNLRDDSVK